ncbi:response regulator [Microseira wollei]|uniref:histidine kinase n=1 Tax=Microseira wollei NIES-4236 TaxID=2530354 RepID=A0AAV3XL04_9CYAN|nr:response regulator [Microseira wollei]GET41122.1 multi-sensor hybrid histidine kinase [Microseira wollei NIES-4236]
MTEDNKGNILIVDDTPENLQVLSATLSDRGYKVRGVIKGTMAIRAAKSAPPDLILLDIKMPDLSGYEVCEQLKADPQTKEIPVIFISALDEVLDKVKAFEIGGVDYITKPFQVEEVLARVEHQLTIKRLQKQLLTQNEQLQQEIVDRRKAEEAAAAASKAKSQFVANMSHELRTPLNAILGFTQVLLRDRHLSSEQVENLRIISRSGEHLLDLINDVLDFSKIEAGIIGLYETSFDLYRLLDTLEEMFQIKCEQKNLILNFLVSPDVPQFVKTDEKKLRVCLTNLLGNAIKFTSYGSVTLRVQAVLGDRSPARQEPPITNDQLPSFPGSAGERHYQLIFEVEDTGCGIAPAELYSLFDAFVQAEAGKKAVEGTGLGLTITRSYVELMAGKITVSSVFGQGTIFKFNIPAQLAKPAEIITEPLQRVIGLEPNQITYRILVVDDTKENRLLMVKLLEPIGFEVKEAENGEQALELWEKWRPHLIWLDTRMPVMDGMEASKQIRLRERDFAAEDKGTFCASPPLPVAASSSPCQTIIIALTASAFEERRGEILAAGCDDFVRKPFPEQLIFAKMAEYLGLRYVYEDLPQSTLAYSRKRYYASEKPVKLLLQQLAQMPQTWIAQLYQAANEVDEELVAQLIEQIPESYTPLAKALRDLLDDFRLDIIVRLTHSIIK